MKLITVNKVNINVKKTKVGTDIKEIQIIQGNIESFEELGENEHNAKTKLCMVSGRDIYIREDYDYIFNIMLK
jgi:hypothetical protein